VAPPTFPAPLPQETCYLPAAMTDDESPYLLLTPGPLSTTRTVRSAMLRELSTWDPDYNRTCESIRSRLVDLAVADAGRRSEYTTVLIQGSGTFAVESTLGSVIPPGGKIVIASNGAYGARMATIAQRLGIPHTVLPNRETERVDLERLDHEVAADPAITHVGFVHCETTTGIVTDAASIGEIAARHERRLVVDAMSSFAGIHFDMVEFNADFAVSSANKCLQGVPGFAFVIARRVVLELTEGWARSLSLDLFDQWKGLETGHGKWRFTSPTHAVLGLDQALHELETETLAGRHQRYRDNQRRIVAGMELLGFRTLLPSEQQSPIITSFHYPSDERFCFQTFFESLKKRGFMIYPGKVSELATFRIGSIGNIFPSDIDRLLDEIAAVQQEMGFVTRRTAP
jgi:2-aminoethylphosphonate-pyruvate transaminase